MKWDRNNFFRLSGLFCCFMILSLLFSASSSLGNEEGIKKNLPARAILLAPEYTSIIINRGDYVNMDLKVINGGRSDEDIKLSLPSIPKGWNAKIKTYNFDVAGVFVRSDESKTLTFRADPEKGLQTGKYVFPIIAATRDGQLKSATQIEVVTREKEPGKQTEGVTVTSSYPVLEGPNDAKFEFSLEVKNDLEQDAIFNLTYEGPKDWDIKFKPAYEDKYFSSLRIKSRQSSTIAVVVTPPVMAEQGTYPINVKVSHENAEAETELSVLLTGTYDMEVGTPDGRLSLDAFQGKEANLSFYIKNKGSAPQKDITFLSFKPENWKVEFKPEKIDTIAPNELKQVEAIITPAERALVGDYSVNFSVKGEKVTKDLELRVTVKGSTVWGWIGIIIIILVIAGLIALFIKTGRR